MPKRNIEIIHKAPGLLIINKPAGISVTKDRSGADDLLMLLRQQLPDEDDLRLVHRLDKFTSGVMLIATSPESQSKLSSMFEKQLIKKTYLAIVTGFIANQTGTINAPLAHNRKNPQLMRVDRKRGKPAVTHYRLLADFGLAALLAVEPLTGRTHQIRIHLADKAMPLAVDPLYGSNRPIMLSDFKPGFIFKKGWTETPLIDRLTLHAYRIEIPSAEPAASEYIAPLDKKFAAAIKMLTKHNSKGPEAFLNKDHFSAILSARPF
jgi:23S rRNA pseudouridine1911/1915/1917 synthase